MVKPAQLAAGGMWVHVKIDIRGPRICDSLQKEYRASNQHRTPYCWFPPNSVLCWIGHFFQSAKPWPYVQGKSQGRFEEAAYFSGLSMTKLPPPQNRRRKKSMCSFGFGTRYPRRMPSNRNSPKPCEVLPTSTQSSELASRDEPLHSILEALYDIRRRPSASHAARGAA